MYHNSKKRARNPLFQRDSSKNCSTQTLLRFLQHGVKLVQYRRQIYYYFQIFSILHLVSELFRTNSEPWYCYRTRNILHPYSLRRSLSNVSFHLLSLDTHFCNLSTYICSSTPKIFNKILRYNKLNFKIYRTDSFPLKYLIF